MSMYVKSIFICMVITAYKTEMSLAGSGMELLVSYIPNSDSSPTSDKLYGYYIYNISESGVPFKYGSRPVTLTAGFICLSICSDYSSDRIFLHEYSTSTIYMKEDHSRNNSRTLMASHKGPGSIYTKIAFDWLSKSLYWTDPMYGWIGVMSTRNASLNIYRILVHENIEKPHGIALDPFQGYLFWTDIGRTVTIERSSLSGEDRKVLISSGLVMPLSIAADFRTEKIFWIDEERDTIETAIYDGSDRKVIRRLVHTTFFDIEIFKEFVYVTDESSKQVIIIDKNNNGMNLLSYAGHTPYAIVFHHSEAQPTKEIDYCGILQCSHICISRKSGATCMCKEGFTVNQDGKTCSEDTKLFHRGLVISNSTSICVADIHAITSIGYQSTCFIQTTDITHIELDTSRGEVVYANRTGLYYTAIHHSSVYRLLTVSGKISGLSFEWIDRSIYWSEEDTGIIALVSKDRGITFTLLSKLDSPRHIVTLPLERRMLWVSGSYLYRIESSRFDGSDRKAVVEFSSLSTPAAISFDPNNQRLYFLDNTDITSCNLDGSDVRKLAKANANTESVYVYKEYLLIHYWSSSASQSILNSYSIEDFDLLRENPSQFQSMRKITAVKVFDDRLQPIRKGPCEELNGGCEQICIATGLVNKVCRCQLGFQTDTPNGNSCSSSPVYNNFLLVSDWTHNMIYQLSLDTNDVQAVDIKKMTDPTGIVYDYTRGIVVWGSSSEQQIFAININGSSEAFVLPTGDRFNAYPERFAIDVSTDNIYYTAISVNNENNSQTGYIAVFSLRGLHKRLLTGLESPRAIDLYPSKGLMFWTSFGSDPHIGRASMDGGNRIRFIYTALIWPNGLAIDYTADRLYWADGYTDRIESCKLDGTDRKSVFLDNDAHLMDIALDNAGNLYYTAWNRPYITKLVLSGPSKAERIFENPELGRLDALDIYTGDVQPRHAMCSHNNGNCSTFCIPTMHGRICACEDGISLSEDEKICSNVILSTENPTTSTSPRTFPATTKVETGQTSTFIAVGVSVGFFVVIVAVILTVCFYRKKTFARHGGGERSERILSQKDVDVHPQRPVSTISDVYADISDDQHSSEPGYMTVVAEKTGVGSATATTIAIESGLVDDQPHKNKIYESKISDYEILDKSVANAYTRMGDIPKSQVSEYEAHTGHEGNDCMNMKHIPKLPVRRDKRLPRRGGDITQPNPDVMMTSNAQSVDFRNIAFA